MFNCNVSNSNQMTQSHNSLSEMITYLREDIDECKDRMDWVFEEKSSCNAPCKCACASILSKRHKNYVSVSRKRTGDCTVTELEIVPRCSELHETCVTDRSIVDVCIRKQSSFPKKTDIEIHLLPNTNNRITNSSNFTSSRKNDCHTLTRNSISPLNSSTTFYASTSNKKNIAIQCDFSSDLAEQDNNFMDSIQTKLEKIKKKLKGNIELKNLIEEIERDVKRISLCHACRLNVGEAGGDNGNQIKPGQLTILDPFSPSYKGNLSDDIIEDSEALPKLTIQELKKTCEKLEKERDSSLQIAANKNAELVEALVHEADTKRKLTETNTKITDMAIKLERYAVSMKNLNEHLKKLKNENKDIEKLKQQTSYLSAFLRNLTQENRSLLSELQLVTHERNQLQIDTALQEHRVNKPHSLPCISTEVLCPDQTKPQFWPAQTDVKEFENLRVPSTDVHLVREHYLSSTPLLGFESFWSKSDSSNSARTPSPSSDHPFTFEQILESNTTMSEKCSSQCGQHFDFDGLKKIREEIKIIFSEITRLANYNASMPEIKVNLQDDKTT